MFKLLEKKIIGQIKQIELGNLSPYDSLVGKWLNQLKDIDEPAYDTLLERYKKALAKVRG